MSTKQMVRFGPEVWAKGTRGNLRGHATDRAEITDLRMWDDGSLGPRPLWYDPFLLDSVHNASARIWCASFKSAYDRYPGVHGIAVASSGGCEFYQFGSSTAYATVATAMTNISRLATVNRIDDVTWLVNGWMVLLSDPTVAYAPVLTNAQAAIDTEFGTALGTFRCRGSAVHQSRAFYWGESWAGVGTPYFNLNRIYYSDAYSYATFDDSTTTGSQYFDIDGSVAGAVSLGTALYIWTTAGDWFVLQGRGDPANGTLNFLGKGRIPPLGGQPTVMDNVAYFLSSDEGSICRVGPGIGGIDDITLGHLGFDASYANLYLASGPPNPAGSSAHNVIMVPYHTSMRRLEGGAWTNEDYGVTTGASFQVDIHAIHGQEILAEWGQNDPNQWSVYWRPIGSDEPSASSIGDFSEYQETESTALRLPRIFQPDKQVRPVKVVVDLRTWSAAGTYWPTATVTARWYDGQNNTSSLTVGPASDPLSGVAESANKSLRLVLWPDDAAPFTSWFEVELYGMKGVAIEAIAVEFETSSGLIQ